MEHAGIGAASGHPASDRDPRGLSGTAMLGCEWDPAGGHAWVRASARFTRRRGHSGPILLPPSFSAGTKGPLLIELVGRSVWRSSLSEVYLTLLLIWEPESDLAVRGLARSALSGGARRRGVGDRGPRLRAPRLSGTASAWLALPRRLCRAVTTFSVRQAGSAQCCFCKPTLVLVARDSRLETLFLRLGNALF